MRTYELLGSLALAYATLVRGDWRPCDPTTADPRGVGGPRLWGANKNRTAAAAGAARNQGAA